jgi:hypothetical protein
MVRLIAAFAMFAVCGLASAQARQAPPRQGPPQRAQEQQGVQQQRTPLYRDIDRISRDIYRRPPERRPR